MATQLMASRVVFSSIESVSQSFMTRVTFRDLKRTSGVIQNKLRVYLETMLRSISMITDIDLVVDLSQEIFNSSYHNDYPAKTTCSPRKVPLWNQNLNGLRAF